VVSLAQVIGTSVNDNGSTDDGVRADEREVRVGDLNLGDTRAVGLEVAQVTNVPNLGSSVTVSGTGRVEVGTSGSAPVRVVAELVNVETSLGVGVHVLDLTRDGDGTAGGLLGEGDHALDGGVALEDCDGLVGGRQADRYCERIGGFRGNTVTRSCSHNP
jgi:hypothetical protein